MVLAVDSEAAKRPIKVPDHPYIGSLKDFGSDELVAGFFDIGSTFVLNAVLSAQLKLWVLPFAGPVFEKGLFFASQAIKAYQRNKHATAMEKKGFGPTLREGLRKGKNTFLKDLLIHDPLYILGMFYGLRLLPGVHPAILSIFSYVIAVLLAALIDVWREEWLFKRKKRELEKLGFRSERYWESRFYVLKNPAKVLQEMIVKFKLKPAGIAHYQDTYFGTKLPRYSQRSVSMRLRNRSVRKEEHSTAKNPRFMHSAQIVYTLSLERSGGIDQVRYFPNRKEKLYAILKKPAKTIADIPSPVRELYEHNHEPSTKTNSVRFSRAIYHNEELAICVDSVSAKQPFYVVELKVWNDLNLLKEAMHYLMVECPIAAVQTTHRKPELIS